jgi:hypothetical protein
MSQTDNCVIQYKSKTIKFQPLFYLFLFFKSSKMLPQYKLGLHLPIKLNLIILQLYAQS